MASYLTIIKELEITGEYTPTPTKQIFLETPGEEAVELLMSVVDSVHLDTPLLSESVLLETPALAAIELETPGEESVGLDTPGTETLELDTPC